jgi:hypothetical protein
VGGSDYKVIVLQDYMHGDLAVAVLGSAVVVLAQERTSQFEKERKKWGNAWKVMNVSPIVERFSHGHLHGLVIQRGLVASPVRSRRRCSLVPLGHPYISWDRERVKHLRIAHRLV